MLSIFQHFHAIPLRSPLISLRSKWRLTGFSRRFTPKNPVRLHNPFGELPRWGAKNVLPLNLIALPFQGLYLIVYHFTPQSIMLLKSPPPGETSPQATEGVHFPMWRPCRGSLSRAKLVPGLHIKGLSNKSPDRCRRRGFTVLPPTGGIINSLPLKGKRLTTFCVSLTLLQNVFAVHRRAAIHNPRVKGPSNLRTLRP